MSSAAVKSNKKRRARLESEGLCTRCGKNPKTDTSKTCKECSRKANKATGEYNKLRYKKLELEGLCVKCGKSPSTNTSKRCEDCSKKAVRLGKEWHKNHPEQTKKARNKKARQFRKKTRFKVIELYGGKCACCGEQDKSFLQIDHENGDGKIYRKVDIWNPKKKKWETTWIPLEET